MLLYVDEVLTEIEALTEYGRIVRRKFDQGRGADELLLDAQALNVRAMSLDVMMPEGTNSGSLLRHANFLVYWLERDDIPSCTQDIIDIVDSDLPYCKSQVEGWSRELVYVDAELREQVLPLLRTKQFDSAIRKAFVILKSRLCAKFNLDEAHDGARLIGQVFGPNSPHMTQLDAGQKQAYRDLFAGLFGLLRNKFAHNNVEPTLSELDTILSSINLCLNVIGDFKSEQDAPV